MLTHAASPARWKINVYRVDDELHQKRVLRAFDRIGDPNVVALGTRSGPDHFVVMECATLATEIRARRIVMTIDPRAERTYECESRPEEQRTAPLPGLRRIRPVVA